MSPSITRSGIYVQKSKYISPQSVTINNAVAVTIFNEGELSIYGFIKDLQLKLTYLSFSSIIKLEQTKQKRRSYMRKAKLDRRTRRQKLGKERGERDLIRLEGGQSYKSSSFGSETTFSNIPKKIPSRTRRPRGRRITATSPTIMTPARDKDVKRRHDDLVQVSSSFPSNSSSNTDDSSGNSSESVCDICEQRQPSTERHRSIVKLSKIKWVG